MRQPIDMLVELFDENKRLKDSVKILDGIMLDYDILIAQAEEGRDKAEAQALGLQEDLTNLQDKYSGIDLDLYMTMLKHRGAKDE